VKKVNNILQQNIEIKLSYFEYYNNITIYYNTSAFLVIIDLNEFELNPHQTDAIS